MYYFTHSGLYFTKKYPFSVVFFYSVFQRLRAIIYSMTEQIISLPQCLTMETIESSFAALSPYGWGSGDAIMLDASSVQVMGTVGGCSFYCHCITPQRRVVQALVETIGVILASQTRT